VHPICSSHEEKRACVRLSMGGQCWPDFNSWKAAMGAHQREREGEGEREEVVGATGVLLGAPWGGVLLSAHAFCVCYCMLCCAVCEVEEE
jgi:hypothetical protein